MFKPDVELITFSIVTLSLKAATLKSHDHETVLLNFNCNIIYSMLIAIRDRAVCNKIYWSDSFYSPKSNLDI